MSSAMSSTQLLKQALKKKPHDGRWSTIVEDDFVVFMIGMRVNKPWKPAKWIPVAKAMLPMQIELRKNPELGCIHIENWFSRTTISLQYWKDVESLHRYSRGDHHLPAWREFNRAVKDSGDVGIWHETFHVRAGDYETVYGNMPRFGLANLGTHLPASEIGHSAAYRLGASADDQPKEAPY